MTSADASPLDRSAAIPGLAGDGAELCRRPSIPSGTMPKRWMRSSPCARIAQQPFSRALLMEYRAAMLEKKLSASTVNVRLSAVRKLIGEAQRNGIIGAEEAANLAGVPNLPQKGTRLGNWLTRDQAKELLTVPDRSTIKGKRDYVILSLLWAALYAGRSWPAWTLTVSRCGRADGSSPIFVAKAAESVPWRFHSGSSTESTPG